MINSKLKVEKLRETFVDFSQHLEASHSVHLGAYGSNPLAFDRTIGKYARMLNSLLKVSGKICIINCTLFSVSMGRKVQ